MQPPAFWVKHKVPQLLGQVQGCKVSHVAPCPLPAQLGVEGHTDLRQAGCLAGMAFSEHYQHRLLALGTWGGFAALVQNAAAPVLLRAPQGHLGITLQPSLSLSSLKAPSILFSVYACTVPSGCSR